MSETRGVTGNGGVEQPALRSGSHEAHRTPRSYWTQRFRGIRLNTTYSKIGPWTEIKHEIISKYAKAYTTILTKNRLNGIYIDAFAGEVMYQSRTKKELVPGSTQLALAVQPPFQHYHFIDFVAFPRGESRARCSAANRCIDLSG